MIEFTPHPLLKNAHLMTIVPGMIPRGYRDVQGTVERVFTMDGDNRILAHCTFKYSANANPTVILVHGLEGSSQSSYMRGLARKALAAGMNVVRLNLRNCGGTAHLTKTLYNAGLSGDVLAVAKQLRDVDGCENIFAVGYSLGGNIVLKAAAEASETKEGCQLLAGVCAVSPSIDLALSVVALARGINRIYELRFLGGLKEKIRMRNKLSPGVYDVGRLKLIDTIYDFDDTYTAPHSGYGTADNYYRTASALPLLDAIRIPTFIITAQDDPIVPFESFCSDKINNRFIRLLAPEHGGHGGFYSSMPSYAHSTGMSTNDRFWVEHRVVDYIQSCRSGSECVVADR